MISFNGTSQYVSTTNSAACPSAAQSFLLSAWVKTSTTPATSNRAVVGWAEDGSNDSVCGIRMDTSGQLGIAVKPDGAGSLQQSFVAINCADGNLHFVVMWYDQATLTLSGLVDNAATPVTRTLTSGQTLALTRFTAGVQIRAGVDASTYWTGELAEVVFMRGGTYTEAHARALYNIGLPKRGQVPGTAQARWPFETNAAAAGGAGPDLTETGTPTYNDNEDATFAAIDAYTATTLSNTAASLVEEGDLDSGTSHYQRVTTPAAGHIVVGFVWDLTDGVTSGQNIALAAPFSAVQTRGTADPFANKLSDYVENSFRYLTVPSAGDWMFRVYQPAGSTAVLRGVSIRYDGNAGIVPMFGNNFHCWPTAITHGGSDYTMTRGLDQRATIGVVKDGTVVYNSDAVARVNAGDDTYHSGAAIIGMDAGVALVSVQHNGASEVTYAAGGNFTNSQTWHTVSTGDNTYAVLAVDSSNDVHFLTRGTDDASNGYHLVRYKLAGLELGAPTVTFDHLGGDGTRQYPNTVYKSGDLLAYAWTGAWNYGFSAIYDGSVNRWYDFAGNQMGGASLGTIATPRFDSTVWTTAMTAGTGIRIDGGAGSNYQAAALFDLTNFPTTDAKGGFLYAKTAGALNELAATTISWVVQDGANKYVSGTDFSAPADWDCNYWRVFAAVRWLDDDPSTNIAILFLIDHDDREAGGNYDTALPTGYTPYYDLGGRRIRVYKITNPLSSSPSFSLVSSPSVTTPTLTTGFVRSVPGKLNTFRWQEATTELHEVKRQGLEYEWEYVESAGGVVGNGFVNSLGLSV